MLRQFTETVGRFKAGDVRDYPRNVWTQITRDAGKKSLDAFTQSAGLNPALQNPLKGRVKIRPRLGT